MADEVLFKEGKGGNSFIHISNQKATALISLYAGQVLSYQPLGVTEDMMFVSDNAYFQPGKSIKGGIPLCWPWFGSYAENASHPAHGFVRNNLWQVSTVNSLENGDTQIILEFNHTHKTRELWRNSFKLSLQITIGDSLSIELLTSNCGEQTFTISEALHTYFNVGDVSQITITGLDENNYLDKTDDFLQKQQAGEVNISEATDRIYLNTENEVVINDAVLKRQIKIASSGHQNVVVWNPWLEGSKIITDLTDDDYQSFICVETANAMANGIAILPEHSHSLKANYRIISE
jgi:glucose-6-phosphate 1-epimerase